MTLPPDDELQASPAREAGWVAKGLLNTVPIMLAGSIALSFTSPMTVPPDHPQHREREAPSELGLAIRSSLAAAHAASTTAATTGATIRAAALVPASYTVNAGDTVSSISGRFGLATASVLALNGLGWKSVIHPGQILKLTNSRQPIAGGAPSAVEKKLPGTERYTIVAGDTISRIAARFQVTEQSILSANGYSRSSIIYAGSTLAIPRGMAQTALNESVIDATPTVSVQPLQTQAATSHVIKKGESIAAIADRYRLSVQEILTANGLGWSSIIYAGRDLVIPVATIERVDGHGVTILTREMAANAREILAVADSLGVSRRGKIIALATAMQESTLRNLPYGDRDSLGLFQQRPSAGWGSPTQVTTPAYAARLFFGGPRNPNTGITSGLLDIPNWQKLTLTQAAQAVQRSAFPDAYAKWEISATAWVKALS